MFLSTASMKDPTSIELHQQYNKTRPTFTNARAIGLWYQGAFHIQVQHSDVLGVENKHSTPTT
jgi:hypothetical protein